MTRGEVIALGVILAVMVAAVVFLSDPVDSLRNLER